MALVEERLAQEEALRLEAARLAVSFSQAPNVHVSTQEQVLDLAGALEAFIKGEKK